MGTDEIGSMGSMVVKSLGLIIFSTLFITQPGYGADFECSSQSGKDARAVISSEGIEDLKVKARLVALEFSGMEDDGLNGKPQQSQFLREKKDHQLPVIYAKLTEDLSEKQFLKIQFLDAKLSRAQLNYYDSSIDLSIFLSVLGCKKI